LVSIVKDELQHRALPWSRRATQVVLAQHGFDACVIGGVVMYCTPGYPGPVG